MTPTELPWSEEAEQSVLGGLMLDNAAFDLVGDKITRRSFYSSQNGMIYEAIEHLLMANKPADMITVFEQLKRRGLDEQCGGFAYLNALCAAVPSAANARRYAEIIAERAADRALIEQAELAVTMARERGPAVEKLNRIVSAFSALERNQVRSVPVPLSGVVVQRLDRLNDMAMGNAAPRGLTTRFPTLDRLLGGGLQPGRVYLLGARPKIGKSALALWWALLSAIHGGTVALYLSQEMPEEEVGDRALAIASQVSYGNLVAGKLQDIEWGALTSGTEAIHAAPFHVDASSNLTIADIRAKARYVKNLGLLVLDYVQMCAGAEDGAQNRNQELEVISRGIKTLAKELGIPIVVLSALGRKTEDRANGRATMIDYKDCGALEADADAILSLFNIKTIDSGKCTLLGMDVLGNRSGPKGNLVLCFWGDLMSFGESEYQVDTLLEKKKPAPPPNAKDF